jgi:hypothetical protein
VGIRVIVKFDYEINADESQREPTDVLEFGLIENSARTTSSEQGCHTPLQLGRADRCCDVRIRTLVASGSDRVPFQKSSVR